MSYSVVSGSVTSGSQHTRFPCPSPSVKVRKKWFWSLVTHNFILDGFINLFAVVASVIHWEHICVLNTYMRAVLLPLCQLFATQWTIAQQASLSMGFSRQDYRSGLPCPPPEDLLNPGIEPWKPGVKPGVISCNCCIAGRFFTTEPPGKLLLFSGSILIYR